MTEEAVGNGLWGKGQANENCDAENTHVEDSEGKQGQMAECAAECAATGLRALGFNGEFALHSAATIRRCWDDHPQPALLPYVAPTAFP